MELFVNRQTTLCGGGYNWASHCFISLPVLFIFFSSLFVIVGYGFTFSWFDQYSNLYGTLKKQIYSVCMFIAGFGIYANWLKSLIMFSKSMCRTLYSFFSPDFLWKEIGFFGHWLTYDCICFGLRGWLSSFWATILCEFSLNNQLIWLLLNLILKLYSVMN